MTPKRPGRINWLLERFAYLVTKWAGSSWAFLLALAITTAWIVTGPIYGYSDGWQLVMNTVSSIVTFLMVFLIQRSQNKDSLAMQVKLNELLAALGGASNRLINIEDLSEDEVRALHARYRKLAERVRSDPNAREPHAVQEITKGRKVRN